MQWVGALLGYYVYAIIVAVLTVNFGRSLLLPILLVLPILVALAGWVYVQGSAELVKKFSVRIKSLAGRIRLPGT